MSLDFGGRDHLVVVRRPREVDRAAHHGSPGFSTVWMSKIGRSGWLGSEA